MTALWIVIGLTAWLTVALVLALRVGPVLRAVEVHPTVESLDDLIAEITRDHTRDPS